MVRATGIDVSHHQGDIDWRAVAQSGVGFAFIKATEGTGYVDSRLHQNRAQAHREGLIVGAYHFGHPGNNPHVEAQFFLDTVRPHDRELCCLDLETTDGKSSAEIRAWAKTWLSTVRKATGRRPILYTYPSFITEHLSGHLAGYPLWIASYRDIPDFTGWRDWLFWQNTSDGSVPGVAGRVDRDIYNGTLDELRAYVGLDQPKPTPKPTSKPKPTPKPVPRPDPAPHPDPAPLPRKPWWSRFAHWF